MFFKPDLMSLAFAFVLVLFIFFEWIRVFHIWIPGINAQKMDEFLRQFTEQPAACEKEKTTKDSGSSRTWDAGPLILSHVYLLLGSALPFWLTEAWMRQRHINWTLRNRSLIMFASTNGIFTIGIADLLASLIGQKLGRLRWVQPTTKSSHHVNKKTLTGSLGGFMGLMFSWALVAYACGFTIMLPEIVVAGLGSMMLEALSAQNDNLMIPCWTTFFLLQFMNSPL